MKIINNQLVEIETRDIIDGKLTIPAQVTRIDPYCGIYTEDKIVEISVDEGNSSFTTKDGVLYSTDMTQLIKYPSKKQGSKFEIPDSVTRIGESAFENCGQLKQITIPAGLIEIGTMDFYGLNSLKEFVVDEGNPSFTTKDGVLYSTDMTQLIKYPPNKKGNKYTIAFQTMRIGSMAFHSCKQLKRIVLPEKLERICSLTFAESGIQSIKIPSSVRKIGDFAFECCDNLEALEIPEGVKNIGNSIVVGCASLKTLELPTSLEIILSNSFNGCINLNSIVVPSKWTSKIEEYLKTSNLPKNRIKQITITCKEKEKEDRNKEFRGKYTTGSNGEGVVKPSTNQLSDSIISPEIR